VGRNAFLGLIRPGGKRHSPQHTPRYLFEYLVPFVVRESVTGDKGRVEKAKRYTVVQLFPKGLFVESHSELLHNPVADMV
jgi:hypothetical protein